MKKAIALSALALLFAGTPADADTYVGGAACAEFDGVYYSTWGAENESASTVEVYCPVLWNSTYLNPGTADIYIYNQDSTDGVECELVGRRNPTTYYSGNVSTTTTGQSTLTTSDLASSSFEFATIGVRCTLQSNSPDSGVLGVTF